MEPEQPGFRPLEFERYAPDVMQRRAQHLLTDVQRRRSVREFSAEPLPQGVLDDCIRLAGTAPSGAHKQPWTFVVVSDPALKRAIREAAEEEERANYSGRMNPAWLKDLAPLGTDAHKPFLEVAPALIVAFRHAWQVGPNGQREQCYYTQESIGIACGFLLLALHHCGLATLTHTPSPMAFLSKLLGRPENEKPFLLIPVGFPAGDCQVPNLERKPLDSIRFLANPPGPKP
ncbi:MAG TPA: nitroreductase family protein [Planctomycetota bacterium]|nr:nitroreductase family protein [Planctomycetota bacterium]HRV79882.1 nitroreductase family protein [Planctomycetota bacterium]